MFSASVSPTRCADRCVGGWWRARSLLLWCCSLAPGLLVKSFGRLLAVDPGFSSQGVVMVQLFAWDRHGSPDRLRTFFKSTLDQLQVLPGVEAAGAVSAMPFALSNINIRSVLDVVGRPAAQAAEQRSAYRHHRDARVLQRDVDSAS